MFKQTQTVKDRLLSHARTEGDCLLWTGYIDRKGYAHIMYAPGGQKPRSCLAHRVMSAAIGYVHNVCGHRHCINPAHWKPCPPKL